MQFCVFSGVQQWRNQGRCFPCQVIWHVRNWISLQVMSALHAKSGPERRESSADSERAVGLFYSDTWMGQGCTRGTVVARLCIFYSSCCCWRCWCKLQIIYRSPTDVPSLRQSPVFWFRPNSLSRRPWVGEWGECFKKRLGYCKLFTGSGYFSTLWEN